MLVGFYLAEDCGCDSRGVGEFFVDNLIGLNGLVSGVRVLVDWIESPGRRLARLARMRGMDLRYYYELENGLF